MSPKVMRAIRERVIPRGTRLTYRDVATGDELGNELTNVDTTYGKLAYRLHKPLSDGATVTYAAGLFEIETGTGRRAQVTLS